MNTELKYHDEGCDCAECCVGCGFVPGRGWSLSDYGRCDECTQTAHEFAMMAAYDRSKAGR